MQRRGPFGQLPGLRGWAALVGLEDRTTAPDMSHPAQTWAVLALWLPADVGRFQWRRRGPLRAESTIWGRGYLHPPRWQIVPLARKERSWRSATEIVAAGRHHQGSESTALHGRKYLDVVHAVEVELAWDVLAHGAFALRHRHISNG